MRAGVPDRPMVPDEAEPRYRVDAPRPDDGRSPDGLSRRLESLPDGHPSSPNNADGSRRDPPVRLRDLDSVHEDDEADTVPSPAPQAEERSPEQADDPSAESGDTTHPDDPRHYTDAEWADHRAEVPIRLNEARKEGLDTTDRFSIDGDGDAWTPDRRAVHLEIIDDLYNEASNVPCDHKAIMAGGLAGAGKTTVLPDRAGIDRSQYLTINPDNIKVEMAERGLIPKVEGLSPMEASDLVHMESSHIANQLARKARADGKNLIWDITMSSLESTDRRINDLRADGYSSIGGIFVDIPIEVSLVRADARHREGEDDYRAGKGLGGRYVPPEIITGQADDQWGSQNRRTFETVKPRLDYWTMFDNGVDHRDAIRIATSPSADDPRETVT